MNKKFLIGIGIMFVGVLFIIIKLVIPNDKTDNVSLENYIEQNEKCSNDISKYIKDNIAYLHCIGDKGNIIKYTKNRNKINKEVLEFDYSNASNISQIHITIDGADADYVYLKSAVKVNDSIKDGEFVKCSLSTKKCEYYNGNRVSDIEVEKTENQNLNKFNIYLERDSRIIYLSSLLEEVYLNKNKNKITLKDYISKSYQTLDDSINHVTDSMIKTETLRDGGTIIYKNEIFDITLVKCNTTKGNKDIFIGDYKMKFDDESMCNR
ncbi:MAG: hypothetical protein VZS44_10760 [Bacilli bacterium]|nr:hypothetical protein [Bacilli bacterium]